jgi:hypothetical protein
MGRLAWVSWRAHRAAVAPELRSTCSWRAVSLLGDPAVLRDVIRALDRAYYRASNRAPGVIVLRGRPPLRPLIRAASTFRLDRLLPPFAALARAATVLK